LSWNGKEMDEEEVEKVRGKLKAGDGSKKR